MAPHYSRLTDEEKERNAYGLCLKYNYSSTANFKYPSSYPGVFKDIDVCRTRYLLVFYSLSSTKK